VCHLICGDFCFFLGELHALILPYSLPPPRRLELGDIAHALASGKYKNVIILVGAGVSSRFSF
jgi:hypothetical protein